MEVKREPALRVRELNAHQLLRGGELEGANRPARLEGEELEQYVEERVLLTTLDKTVAWARSNSFFPLGFGLACCAMEQFHAAGPRMDIARFGFEAFRASPRQADLIILAGRVSIKMAPIIRKLYDQMLEPKWAISMGACCSSMGVFNNYALVPADKFMPVDLHVPGLPAAPGGVDARDPQAAQAGPGRPGDGLARALRRGRHRGGSRGCVVATGRRLQGN